MKKDIFVILSAESAALNSLENSKRTEILAGCLSDLNIDFERVQGMYKGQKENSFIVYISEDDYMELGMVLKLAFMNFKQESVLLHFTNNGFLLYPGKSETIGKVQPIGKYKECNTAELSQLEAYTMAQNRCFTYTD